MDDIPSYTQWSRLIGVMKEVVAFWKLYLSSSIPTRLIAYAYWRHRLYCFLRAWLCTTLSATTSCTSSLFECVCDWDMLENTYLRQLKIATNTVWCRQCDISSIDLNDVTVSLFLHFYWILCGATSNFHKSLHSGRLLGNLSSASALTILVIGLLHSLRSLR